MRRNKSLIELLLQITQPFTPIKNCLLVKCFFQLSSPFGGQGTLPIRGQGAIFFLSDFHLGAPDVDKSLEREKIIVRFLDEIKNQASAIFIVGDMFDFWYEYKKVVPKGHVRLLGKIASLTDAGIPVHFFVGNHDMWMKTYLQQELNVSVYFEPKEFTFSKKHFYIGPVKGLCDESVEEFDGR